MRNLIEICEVLKISNFFPRYGSQRPRFNWRVRGPIEVCEVLEISNFLHHYRSRRPRLSSTCCQDYRRKDPQWFDKLQQTLRSRRSVHYGCSPSTDIWQIAGHLEQFP